MLLPSCQGKTYPVKTSNPGRSPAAKATCLQHTEGRTAESAIFSLSNIPLRNIDALTLLCQGSYTLIFWSFKRRLENLPHPPLVSPPPCPPVPLQLLIFSGLSIGHHANPRNGDCQHHNPTLTVTNRHLSSRNALISINTS